MLPCGTRPRLSCAGDGSSSTSRAMFFMRRRNRPGMRAQASATSRSKSATCRGTHALPVILISWPIPNPDVLWSRSTARRAPARAPSPSGLPTRLGFTYIDTGAMYRAVALWARAAERRAPTICTAWSNSRWRPRSSSRRAASASTARTSPRRSARRRSRTARPGSRSFPECGGPWSRSSARWASARAS